MILSTLEWSKLGGGSGRQLEDVRELVRIKAADLDRRYLEAGAAELDVLDAWREVAGD